MQWIFKCFVGKDDAYICMYSFIWYSFEVVDVRGKRKEWKIGGKNRNTYTDLSKVFTYLYSGGDVKEIGWKDE